MNPLFILNHDHQRRNNLERSRGCVREGLPLWLASITVRKPKPRWERRLSVTPAALLFLSRSSPLFGISQTSLQPPPPTLKKEKKRKLNNIFHFSCGRLVFGTEGPNLTRRLIPGSLDGRESAIKPHYVVSSFDVSPPTTVGLLRLI